MSSFMCSVCKEEIIDTPQGYITGCEHWPLEKTEVTRIQDKQEQKCDGSKFIIDDNGYWEIIPECDGKE